MDSDHRRPRLLYFNGPWDYLGRRMRASFIEPFQRLLEQDFEVISVEGDRDFAAEVAQHRPDLALFHTGCEAPAEPEVTIRHTDAHPDLPRAGFIFRDPFSPSRMLAMNRLRAWGVHQVFSLSRPSDSLAPYFRDVFYLPWWIDDTLFRDYAEPKSLPLTFTGAGWLNKCIYTWRHDVFLQLLPRFPVFHAPSLGNRQSNHDYVGESYARLLNRSLFSAGCGTVNRYLTLKLLEIPAARSCLITEETEVLKALGFRDGVNCVFADPANVVAKVQALLDDPARLAEITAAGHDLVHQRHTARQRRVIAEWFQLWRARRAGERIVQVHALEPLQVVAPDAAAPASTFPTENPLLDDLREGHRRFAAGRWAEALPLFEKVVAIIPCVAEARLGAALCLLRLNRANDASSHLGYNLNLMVKHFGYRHPDPIDAACTALLCVRMKDPASAASLLASYEYVRHPALTAMRALFAARHPAQARGPAFARPADPDERNVETVHVLPPQTFVEWTAFLRSFLS